MAKRWYYKDANGNKVPVQQYKINADDYYTKAMSDSRYYEKSATDTLLAEKVSKTDIVQSTGTSTTAVMSQKASTMAFAANTPSGDPLHNMYVEVGAIYNDTGKDIERVDQWGDTIIHKDGCWYLNGLGNLTNADMDRCWVYGNCIYNQNYCFYISPAGGFSCKTNIPLYGAKYPKVDAYDNLRITNYYFLTFCFNNSEPSKPLNNAINCYNYRLFNCGVKKYYGWIVVKNVLKSTFSNNDDTECIGLVLTANSYINLPKLRAECIRQIIDAVRATENITITLHPEAYERAIADAGVQTALANKTNVSLAKGE